MSTESAQNLENLLSFLHDHVCYQIDHLIDANSTTEKPPLTIEEGTSLPLNNLIHQYELPEEDVILLLTALAPHVQPGFYDNILAKKFPSGGSFPEFGGHVGKRHRGIMPTGETALFILGGSNIANRIEGRKLFDNQRFLFRTGVLSLGLPESGEPRLSGQLLLDEEYTELLTTGLEIKPDLSPTFPAELINTDMEWSNLILQQETIDEVQEIETWLKHNDTLLNDWDMGRIIKPGYRVMFYGAPGTGKTLTASLLGKYTNRDVYRIDLSMVVSKYIGETEKNLSSLFNKAKNKDWILFFDEADAIFGKRTNVRDAHDKYANQEVSYLLQRIEAHPGLVILASNFKSNIDEAFTRRFHSLIEFKVPSSEERLRLWEMSLPQEVSLAADVNLSTIAQRYELTGANIVNAIHFACLKQLEEESQELKLEYIEAGIMKEYRKEGKSF
ncbi:MAG: ATP-binding protein [bacterium]|nr:ATP-binding protein [bacterium]